LKVAADGLAIRLGVSRLSDCEVVINNEEDGDFFTK